MTTLWSKVMESYIASYTLLETKSNWKQNQHGGKQGLSTDHVLIQFWDSILSDLDTSSNRAAASVLSVIDFSKSFSRCLFQTILQFYKQLGSSQWILEMYAVFLTNRMMSVKVGNVVSTSKPVTGGAVYVYVYVVY